MWNDYGNQVPIIVRPYVDYGPISKKRHHGSAGTKGKCKHCGRPTYRMVGSAYVCSYCDHLETGRWPNLPSHH